MFRSFNVKIPTKLPASFATATPFLIFAILFAASRTVKVGNTMSSYLRFSSTAPRLQHEFESPPPENMVIMFPINACTTAACSALIPFIGIEFLKASITAASFPPPTTFPDASTFSIFEIASYIHLAISSTATIPPSLPKTGR